MNTRRILAYSDSNKIRMLLYLRIFKENVLVFFMVKESSKRKKNYVSKFYNLNSFKDNSNHLFNWKIISWRNFGETMMYFILLNEPSGVRNLYVQKKYSRC